MEPVGSSKRVVVAIQVMGPATSKVLLRTRQRRRQHTPLCEQDAAVAGAKSIALPLLQIVIVFQPLVQAVANKELYELANATVDGLHLVRLGWWHLQGGLQCAGRWIGYVEM